MIINQEKKLKYYSKVDNNISNLNDKLNKTIEYY